MGTQDSTWKRYCPARTPPLRPVLAPTVAGACVGTGVGAGVGAGVGVGSGSGAGGSRASMASAASMVAFAPSRIAASWRRMLAASRSETAMAGAPLRATARAASPLPASTVLRSTLLTLLLVPTEFDAEPAARRAAVVPSGEGQGLGDELLRGGLGRLAVWPEPPTGRADVTDLGPASGRSFADVRGLGCAAAGVLGNGHGDCLQHVDVTVYSSRPGVFASAMCAVPIRHPVPVPALSIPGSSSASGSMFTGLSTARVPCSIAIRRA